MKTNKALILVALATMASIALTANAQNKVNTDDVNFQPVSDSGTTLEAEVVAEGCGPRICAKNTSPVGLVSETRVDVSGPSSPVKPPSSKGSTR